MRLLKVQARNFLSYRDLEFDLANRGLTLILGRNYDSDASSSNGAGKTALLDTITFTLWGRTLRGLSGDAAINREAGTNCFTSISLETDQGLYSITRSRTSQGGTLLLELNGHDITGPSMRATQATIDEILGLNYETAIQCLILGQGPITHFVNCTDQERKTILDSILNLSILGEAREVTRSQLQSMTTDRDNKSLLLSQLGDRRDSLYEEVVDLAGRRDNFENQRQRRIRDLDHRLRTLNGELRTLQQKQNKRITELQDRRIAVQEEIDELAVAVGATQTVKDKLQHATHAVIEKQLDYKRVSSDIDVLRTKIEKFSSVFEENFCPTCERPLERNEREKILDGLTMEATTLRSRRGSLQSELEVAQNTRQEYEDGFNEYEKMHTQLQRLFQSKASVIADLENTSSATSERNVIDREMSSARLELARVQDETWDMSDVLGRKQEEYREIETEIARLQPELEALTQKIPYYEYWDKGFSNSGLKSFALDNIMPILSNFANRYARILLGEGRSIFFSTRSQLKSGEERERLSISAIDEYGNDFFEGASAGELQRINICVGLALQQLVIQRSRQSLNLVIYDEIFQNLDDEGIERVVRLLKTELTDVESAFVITHDERLANTFDNVIRVEKRDGVSKVLA